MALMKRYPLFWTLLALAISAQGTASAQAMVENAMGAGRAATMTAPAKGIGGALNNLEKTLNKTVGATEESTPPASPKPAARTAASAPAAAAPAPAPVVHYEDAAQIETGLVYSVVVKRYGPPALEITTGTNTKTLSYRSRASILQIELLDGKVTSVFDVTNGTMIRN